jgi:hypothetical protein
MLILFHLRNRSILFAPQLPKSAKSAPVITTNLSFLLCPPRMICSAISCLHHHQPILFIMPPRMNCSAILFNLSSSSVAMSLPLGWAEIRLAHQQGQHRNKGPEACSTYSK